MDMLFLVCTILFHYSFFQILQHLQIIGISSLRLHLFALGVENIIYLLGFFLSFIVRNTTNTLQDVFFLECQQIIHILAPIVKREITTPLSPVLQHLSGRYPVVAGTVPES